MFLNKLSGALPKEWTEMRELSTMYGAQMP